MFSLAGCDRTSGVAGGIGGPSYPSEEDFVWPPPIPEPTTPEDARCRGLDSSSCDQDPACVAARRSSRCTWDGECTEDLIFDYCYAYQKIGE